MGGTDTDQNQQALSSPESEEEEVKDIKNEEKMGIKDVGNTP